MPTVTVQCPNRHDDVRYLKTWDARMQPSKFCGCGHPMIEQPSFGTPLLYFRENRAQYIENLDATIASYGEHMRVMKERGVEPATDWHTSKSISDGLVPQAKREHPSKKVLG